MESTTYTLIISSIMWMGIVVYLLINKDKQRKAVKYQLQKKENLLEEMQITFANYIAGNGGTYGIGDGMDADSLSFRMNKVDYTLKPSNWVIDGVEVPFQVFFLRFINDSLKETSSEE